MNITGGYYLPVKMTRENTFTMTKEIRYVAIYCRVSTREQTTENQVLILEEHAKRMGWVYDIYEEQESTRKTRPIKYGLMQKLRAGVYDAVCVLKLDRFGRSTIELAADIEELKNKGVMFISLRDNIDLSTASGQLQFNIISAFAQFERDIISERTKDGQARALAQGKKLGRPKGSKDKKQRRRSGYYIRHMDNHKTRKNREYQETFKNKKLIENEKN